MIKPNIEPQFCPMIDYDYCPLCCEFDDGRCFQGRMGQKLTFDDSLVKNSANVDEFIFTNWSTSLCEKRIVFQEKKNFHFVIMPRGPDKTLFIYYSYGEAMKYPKI